MAVLTCGEEGSTGFQIVTQVNENTDAIAGQAVTIANNTQGIVDVNGRVDDVTLAIGENADEIIVNRALIDGNATDVIALQNKMAAVEAWIGGRFYATAAGAVDQTMSETYQTVVELNITDAPAGDFVFGFTFTTSFDSTTKKEFFQFSIDGGVNWDGFTTPVKSTTDREPFVYAYPINGFAGGAFHAIFQARKEDASGVMIVHYSDLTFERKDVDFVPAT